VACSGTACSGLYEQSNINDGSVLMGHSVDYSIHFVIFSVEVSYEQGSESSVSRKGEVFLDQLINYQLYELFCPTELLKTRQENAKQRD
jgi:hypothetical protein